MPELPEAEAQRRLLDRCVVGQTIESVETKEQGGGARDGEVDDKVLDGDVASLAGSRVVAAKRKGKQLWLELDKGKTKHCLLIHLGMTGSCVIKGEAPRVAVGQARAVVHHELELRVLGREGVVLSLIHISEPTRP